MTDKTVLGGEDETVLGGTQPDTSGDEQRRRDAEATHRRESGQSRRAERQFPVRAVVVGLLALASLAAWWLLYRSWFMASDDYTHVGFGGAARGQFSLADWWASVQWDLTSRNGRLADGLLRLMLRPGDWFYPLLAPVILTLLGVFIALTAAPGGWRRANRPALWLWVAGLTTVPLVGHLSPSGFGQGVYWASGFVNYVPTATLVVLCVALFARLGAGASLSWGTTVAAGLLVAFTSALHEMGALAVIGVAVTAALVGRRSLSRQGWALVGVAVVAFLVHMLTPGMWNRADWVAQETSAGGFEQTVHGFAIAAAYFHHNTAWLWWVLAALWGVLALRARRPADCAWALAAGASVVVFGVAAQGYMERVPMRAFGLSGEIPDGMLSWTVLVIASFAVAALVVTIALWRTVEDWGLTPLLSWVGMLGLLGFVLMAGFAVTRSSVPPAVLLVLVLLSMAVRMAADWPDNVRWTAQAAVVLVMGAVAMGWYAQLIHEVRVNKEFVDTKVVPKLERAALRDGGEVRLSRKLPFPDATHNNAFQVPHYAIQLRRYYGIPETVRLDNPGFPDEPELRYPVGY